jgi:hypothetical protein
MRGLAARYFVKFFSRYGLVAGNAYGPFMTRGFAENYPYSPFYKAELKGPREEWDRVVEGLEGDALDPREGFLFLCSLLSNQSEEFSRLATETMRAVESFLSTKPTFGEVRDLIATHVRKSPNSARPLEVAAHSLFQALYPRQPGTPYDLRSLSQMRSANLKAGNVGDVELLQPGTRKVVEAWDAKAGAFTLGEELVALKTKLSANRGVLSGGFLMDRPVVLDSHANGLIADIRRSLGTDVRVVVFEDWANTQSSRTGEDPAIVARDWLRDYAGSLCQLRRDLAPLDEPSRPWVEGLKELVEARLVLSGFAHR